MMIGADDGARTHDLDVGNVVFRPKGVARHTGLNYIRVSTMMFVALNSREAHDVHRNVERKTGLEPMTSSLEDSRSTS